MNPFHKHDVSEFEGVYEPLSDARRHHSVVAAYDERLGNEKEDAKSLEAKGADSESANQYNANTLEGLRAEIDSDIAASGHDSIYDRTCNDCFSADSASNSEFVELLPVANVLTRQIQNH